MIRLKQLGAALIGVAFAVGVSAQSYPSKPIRLVIGFPPGSVADLTGRSVADALSAELKQPIFVDNRPGVTGSLASEQVSRAAPDGYTLLVGNDATHATNQLLFLSVNYDPARDFTPIAPAIDSAIVMVVHRSVPANSVAELVKLAQSGPKLSYGSSGVGSPHHLAGEMFKQAARIDLTHIPYKGGTPALSDALGGQIPILFASFASVKPYLDSGQLKGLAMLTKERYAGRPEIPPLNETYPGVEISGWSAFFGPPGMPPAIVSRLNAGIQRALATPKVSSALLGAGLTPTPGSPQSLHDLVSKEIVRRTKIIRAMGIQRE